MKRDLELIRLLLLRQETDNQDYINKVKTYSFQQIAYHTKLLKEAGYVIASVDYDGNGEPMGSSISSITWQGHEFLDSIRDTSIWNKIKDKTLKPGTSWTIGLLTEWANQEIKTRLGIH